VITDEQYQRLLAFRIALRRFNQWSQEEAESHGLTHAQHQLLLAIRGHVGAEGPTIGEVADYLLVKHHTATGLVDRAQETGLVERVRDAKDSRRVRLRLSDKGSEIISALTAVHLEEIHGLTPLLDLLDVDRSISPKGRSLADLSLGPLGRAPATGG